MEDLNNKIGISFGDIFGNGGEVPSIDKDEPLWDTLIQNIIDGKVIPVIGADLLTDEKDNPHKVIIDFLANGFHVESKPNSFSELVYDPNYKKDNKKDTIYYFVNTFLQKVGFNPSVRLKRLLEIRQFPFVITTSFIPVVEQTMKEIWKDELRVMRFNNNPTST